MNRLSRKTLVLALLVAPACTSTSSSDGPDVEVQNALADTDAPDSHVHDVHVHDVQVDVDAVDVDVADIDVAGDAHPHDADVDADHPHGDMELDHPHDGAEDADHTHDVESDSLEPDVGDTDMIPYACDGPIRVVDSCVDPVRTDTECDAARATHIDEPTPIEYEPLPTCDNHRPQWGKWGEYEFMPPQRWLHNLEHGGAAFLYDPCVEHTLIEELRAYATAVEPDDGGDFRWILTPAPGLASPVAVVTWGHALEMTCFAADTVTAFLADTYRTAPEDVRSDGAFVRLWLNRGPELAPEP